MYRFINAVFLMLTFLVVVYFKMHGDIRKGCTVIVLYKDMPGDSQRGGG